MLVCYDALNLSFTTNLSRSIANKDASFALFFKKKALDSRDRAPLSKIESNSLSEH